jgi:hypothetical protein
MSVFTTGKRHRTGGHAHGVRHKGGHGHLDRRWAHSGHGHSGGARPGTSFTIIYPEFPGGWGTLWYFVRWNVSGRALFTSETDAGLPTSGVIRAGGWEIGGEFIPRSTPVVSLQLRNDDGEWIGGTGVATLPADETELVNGNWGTWD